MTEGSAGFCTGCGAPLSAESRFCVSCGQPRTSPAPQTRSATGAATAAYGAVAQVASVASIAGGLPWQTIIAGQTPDLSGMLSRVAMPGARTLAQRSLKRPGLSMAATTVLDLFVAGISAGPAGLLGALPRVLGGGLTSALSLITGTKGGPLRSLTGAVSLLTALVQVVSLGWTLIGGVRGGSPFLTLAPMMVAMASALVMALKTASVALRRRS